MKTHCRCRECGARRVLKRHPDAYQVQPQCRTCGARNHRPDKWMNERKTITCHADCYHHPHRIGSGNCKFIKPGVYREIV